MKIQHVTVAVAFAALALAGTSCGNKSKSASSDITSEQVSAAMEIDSLLANAEALTDKEVTIDVRTLVNMALRKYS